MLTDRQTASLEEAWAPARAAGVIGSASIETLVEHTAGFARAVCSSFSAAFDDVDARIVDVGTGAGLPGVVLAALLPRVTVTAVDASERRLDHARRAARALGVDDRVQVVHARGDDLGHDPAHRGLYEAAVARLLADPGESLEQLTPLVRPGGVAVVSTASSAVDRWERLPLPDLPLSTAVLSGSGEGVFASVQVLGAMPSEFPRRPKVRRRSPLL